MLCGYCPSKIRLDTEGPVLPGKARDVPYADHAAMHEALGPTTNRAFAPSKTPRPLRPLPARSRQLDDEGGLFQTDQGWD